MIPIQIKILRQNKVVSYFYILEAGRRRENPECAHYSILPLDK